MGRRAQHVGGSQSPRNDPLENSHANGDSTNKKISEKTYLSAASLRERRKFQIATLSRLQELLLYDFEGFITEASSTCAEDNSDFVNFFSLWKAYGFSLVYGLGFVHLPTRSIIDRIHHHLQRKFCATESVAIRRIVLATIYCLYYVQPHKADNNGTIVRYPIPVSIEYVRALIRWHHQEVTGTMGSFHFSLYLARRLTDDHAYQLYLLAPIGEGPPPKSIPGIAPILTTTTNSTADNDHMVNSMENDERIKDAEEYVNSTILEVANALSQANEAYDRAFRQTHLQAQRISHHGFTSELAKLATQEPVPLATSESSGLRLTKNSNDANTSSTTKKKLPVLRRQSAMLPVRPSTAPPGGEIPLASRRSLDIDASAQQLLDYLSIDATNINVDMPDFSGFFGFT